RPRGAPTDCVSRQKHWQHSDREVTRFCHGALNDPFSIHRHTGRDVAHTVSVLAWPSGHATKLALERQFQCKLQNSGIARRGYLPRSGGAQVILRLPEIDVIEGVEKFRAELDLHSFYQGEVFQKP